MALAVLGLTRLTAEASISGFQPVRSAAGRFMPVVELVATTLEQVEYLDPFRIIALVLDQLLHPLDVE
ncbi:hypothetical protein EV643_108315 [Kribbella sp. VKM Ac-2527]|jgi:hypothetical protein|uniref:Uncharacterized protein n=1 Tax=Kribbella caucasensis TaxID=2512215 RepID=A0A4R6KD55_9ACTN|nr:hypothetical protein EV643_108315 [Kribbella sp. VKM Ac-2527]